MITSENIVRIIPTILTKKHTVVKGQNFNNNRVVGTVKSALSVQASRNVDEILLVDVQDDVNSRIESILENTEFAAEFLRIPFCVGGGLSRTEDVREVFRRGADKVLLGHSALHSPGVISECAELFGSQAVTVSLDFQDNSDQSLRKCCARKLGIDNSISSYVEWLTSNGAGELLMTVKTIDGTLSGPAIEILSNLTKVASIPVIYSSGVGRLDDFLQIAKCGASGVAAGAFFQFSQYSPTDVKEYLVANGFLARV